MKLECEENREAWLGTEAGAGAPDDAVAEHFAQCPDCDRFREEAGTDQMQIRKHFASIAIPAAPRLEFRDALTASSGFPRRVSLATVPFLWALLLVLALAILAVWMLWVKQDPRTGRLDGTPRAIRTAQPMAANAAPNGTDSADSATPREASGR